MSYWHRMQKSGPTATNATAQTNGAGASQSRQLAEFCDSIPDDPNKPGYKASPIPHYAGTIGQVDRSDYKLGTVNVADLKTTQPFINHAKLRGFDRSRLPTGDMAHPLVIRTRDQQLVVDNGNHRVAHLIATGQQTTPARIIEEHHGYGGQGSDSIPTA